MQVMINDMIDLVRLRVKPLAHYQYAPWKNLLMVLLLGIIASAGSYEPGNNIPSSITFFVLFIWLELSLAARFMGLWLRWCKGKVTHPLFGLLIVCNGIGVLSPLTSWFPTDMGEGIRLVLALISLLVTINSIATVSEVTRIKVLIGMVGVSLLLVALLQAIGLLSASLGLYLPPPLNRAMAPVMSVTPTPSAIVSQ